MNSATRSFLALLTGGCLLLLTAASPSIGVIRSSGDFEMDGSGVRGNATVFEGSAVQTTAASSKIHLADGTLMIVLPESRVQVYRDHAVLLQGSQSIRNGQKYRIEAGTLQIRPMGSHTVAGIVSDDNQVSVAALKGSVEVRNDQGVLVDTVVPGSPKNFYKKKAGAAGGGAAAAGGALGAGAAGAATGSAAGVAGAAAGVAGAAAGISTGLVAAVVAGVAVTGSVVGLGATGILTGATQPVSRP